MEKASLFLVFTLPAILLAQVTEEWVARYNGPGDWSDGAYSIAVDNEGNVYVTGYSWGSGTNWDYATIKYDQDGNELWVARYNGPGNNGDVASSIALDKEGNVYVTGYSYDSGTYYDYATVKYDPNGNELWVARYNGPRNDEDYAYSIAVDNAGNVYVTGTSGGDYATIKYRQVKDVGITGAIEPIDSVFVNAKYFPKVRVANFTRFRTRAFPCSLVIEDEDANVIYSSEFLVDGLAGSEQRVITFDGWIVPPEGGERYTLYATSHLPGDNNPDNDTCVWKVKSVALDVGTEAILMPSKVSSGDSITPKAIVKNYGTVRASNFDVECIIQPDGYGDIRTIPSLEPGALDTVEFKVWVVGSSAEYTATVTTRLNRDTNPGNDSKTKKVTGIAEYALPTEFALSCIRPNPMSNRTVISYQLPVASKVSLSIYDISGRLVKTLVSRHSSPGYYTAIWNGRDISGKSVPAGIYFLELLTPEYTTTRKIVLLHSLRNSY